MKPLFIGALVALLFFTVKSTYASNGREFFNVPGHECEQGEHVNNPHCTPVATVSPTMTATATPVVQCTPKGTPNESTIPKFTPTPIPTEASTSASPSINPTPTESTTVLRTDLTDGRSDGLGCAQHDCSTKEAGPSGQILPSTGGGISSDSIMIATLIGLVGWRLRKYGNN